MLRIKSPCIAQRPGACEELKVRTLHHGQEHVKHCRPVHCTEGGRFKKLMVCTVHRERGIEVNECMRLGRKRFWPHVRKKTFFFGETEEKNVIRIRLVSPWT